MMTDDLASTNRARWNALVDANVEYTRPLLDMTPTTAFAFLDPTGKIAPRYLNELSDKDVLCLAGGGGQQGVAFALLGANVTIFDLSDRQLARDQEAAAHYGFTVHTVQGDMRHLDDFADASFDIVYQAFSVNFVPDIRPVLAEVARVCRPAALYRIQWANPFTQLVDPETDWTGNGYTMRHPYVDGREITDIFPTWTVDQAEGNQLTLDSPREWVHALSTMINTLVAHGFVILSADEYLGAPDLAEPGNWHHYTGVAVPYLTLWARYLPDGLNSSHT